MNNLVSIVVTSFNHAEFLPQRMESLLAQTYPNTEIIVVDDFSTDGSREYLEQYSTHQKVRLFFLTQNNGFVHASNFGVSQAKGEYIIFAECDDYCEPDQIKSLFQSITQHQGVVACFSGSNLIDENNRHKGFDFDERSLVFQNLCKFDVLLSGNQLLKMMLYANVVLNMSAVMFRKSEFLKIGGLSDKYRLCADMDLWIRMAEVGDFYYLRKPLNNFRTHPDTVRNKLGASVTLLEMLDLISYIQYRIYLNMKEKFDLKMHLGKLWFYYAKYQFSSFRSNFSTVFIKAIRKEPLLLPFILLNIPVLGVRKITRLMKS